MSNILKGKEPIQQIAKLMTLKDDLQGKIFKAVLYRKILLFDDLAVNNDVKGEEVYASPKVVEIYELINRYVEEFRYKPPKLIYEPVTLSAKNSGLYTQVHDFHASTQELMKDMLT
jgi:hypothetical protein